MAQLDESGQWIVLMGILVSIAIFFLAFIINQSTLVGQTTSESVLEFPKNDIQDLRSEIDRWTAINASGGNTARADISALANTRKNAVIWFAINPNEFTDESGNKYNQIEIHFNNGVTVYDEQKRFIISK